VAAAAVVAAAAAAHAKATPTFDIEEQQNPLAEEDQDEEAVQPL
jgi:hypothetical protein